MARVCAGDEAAWQALWEYLDPLLDDLIRRRRLLGGSSTVADDRRAVVVLVMGKLRQDSFRRLRMYVDERERNPGMAHVPWLAVVTRNTAIDYLRAHPDYVATAPRRAGGRGALLPALPLAPGSRGPGARPPVTRSGTAAQLLRYASRELPPPQHRALELWLAGNTASDIAGTLRLASCADAERMVRAAVQRLRRRFVTTLSGSAS